MNFRFVYILIILLLCLGSDVFGSPPEKRFTVVIDPGHGGKDPGTMNKSVKEKDIVLNIALQLGSFIKKRIPDVNIIYTRETDIFIPLHERANIANKNKADLFLSIHVNHSDNHQAIGTETYVLGFHNTEKNLEVAKKENAAILLEDDYSTRYEGFDPGSPESYIMFEMAQSEYRLQSIELGLLVQNKFQLIGNRNNRGVFQAGFIVLKEITMPGILIEAGYLSNSTEAEYLNSDIGQQALAYSIFIAVQQYKNTVENRKARLISPDSKEVLAKQSTSGRKENKAAIEQSQPQYVEKPITQQTINNEPASSLNIQAEQTQSIDNTKSGKTSPPPVQKSRQNKPDKQQIKRRPASTQPIDNQQQSIQQPTVSNQLITEIQSVNQELNDTYFSIQILASKARISIYSDIFKDLYSVFEISQDGLYKYLCYKESSLMKTEKLRSELLKRFPEAFIVAYNKGQRISIEEGIKILDP